MAGKVAQDVAAETGGHRKKMLLGVVVVVLLAVAAYWVALKPNAEAAPEPGEVVVLDPIQINLAQGRYLRIGIALQATLDLEEEVEGSRALDSVIDVFSGVPLDDISNRETREELKSELEARVLRLYEGEVMDVYFTELVTQ